MSSLSVIVPVFNEQDFLSESLDRLISTNIANQILICDDGSKDNSLEIAENYKKKHPNVVVSASILEGASSVSSTTSTDCQTISKHSSCKTSYLSPSKGSSNIKCTLSPLNSIVGIFSHPLETKQSTKETPLTSSAG